WPAPLVPTCHLPNRGSPPRHRFHTAGEWGVVGHTYRISVRSVLAGDVPRGKEQGERAALTFRALDPDFAPQQPRNLAADRKSKTCSTILAARGSVRLLECLEDQALFVPWNSDTGIRY